MMAGVRTSTYFLKCIAPHQKVYHVGKISIHPNFTTKDQNTNDVETSVEFNIAVIQLKESITFDRYIGSVEVLSNQSLTGSNLVVAAWNVSGGDPYGSLYEIPVQIIGNERIHIAKTLLTERPYQKDNGMLDQEVKAKPLIAYKQNGEATLIGLHVAMAGYKKKSLERYITLKQHIPWIKQELEMNIEPPKRWEYIKTFEHFKSKTATSCYLISQYIFTGTSNVMQAMVISHLFAMSFLRSAGAVPPLANAAQHCYSSRLHSTLTLLDHTDYSGNIQQARIAQFSADKQQASQGAGTRSMKNINSGPKLPKPFYHVVYPNKTDNTNKVKDSTAARGSFSRNADSNQHILGK
uniref:Peptidase S1 domain-containing protein n=1 Tax=Romanomermis culicivorax TaxID=13658 RepID=A0A915J848_ROMCU